MTLLVSPNKIFNFISFTNENNASFFLFFFKFYLPRKFFRVSKQTLYQKTLRTPLILLIYCVIYQCCTSNEFKNVDRPNCQSSLFHLWELLLQEVEVDSQSQGDVANVFARQVSRPLLDRSFHRKVQARKIFGHRDSFEIIINKAEEKLAKVYTYKYLYKLICLP